MIMSDGSHVVRETKKLHMIHVKFDISITGNAIFFASNKDIVKEHIDIKLRNLNIPLLFDAQDGSINTKVNYIKVEVEET